MASDARQSHDELLGRVQRLSPSERRLLERLLAERLAAAETITRRAAGLEAAPLSVAQEGLWFVDRLYGARSPFTIYSATRLRGVLDVPALAWSLEQIGRRHEILRSVYRLVDGVPRQLVRAHPRSELPLRDLSLDPDPEGAALRSIGGETRPIDLTSEPPLRAVLLRLAPDDHVLLAGIHHIACDMWSWGIFVRELEELYGARLAGRTPDLEELPVQYADFAVWQRERLEGAEGERQLAYWREALRDAPEKIELVTDGRRSSASAGASEAVPVTLPRALSERVLELGSAHHATPFMTTACAFGLLLSRHARQSQIVLGTPFADRARPEVEHLIGYFVNMLPLRLDHSGDPSFHELLARTRATVVGAYGHHELPFARLVRELRPQRNLGDSPLFQVSFQFGYPASETPRLDGLDVAPMTAPVVAPYDLVLSLALEQGRLEGALAYADDLFHRVTIEEIVRQYRGILEEVVARPDAPISELAPIREHELVRMTVDWNRTREGPSPLVCVHERFEAQARRAPDSVAVACGDEQLTYRELDRRADALAARLQACGVSHGSLVGVCLARSTELVVTLLAVLKAGAAYLPLDPEYPPARLQLMVEDAEPAVIVTRERFAGSLPTGDRPLLLIESEDPEHAEGAAVLDRARVHPDDLAYVMYTSGSTGRPKGVTVTHRGVVGLVVRPNYVDLVPEDRVAQLSTVSFDTSTFELWAPLLNGASVWIFPRELVLSPAALVGAVAANRITVLAVTSALVNDESYRCRLAAAPVRYLTFGGEAANPRAVRALIDGGFAGDLVYTYGPTEATMLATYERIFDVPERGERLPIGRPVSGSEISVLDDRLKPVPPGVPGELCVGGERLARGYLRRPALTAERFVPNPFSHRPGARIYRTGDLARYRPDGRIEFLGRLDRQVKIRGFRVEPDEVECVLGAVDGVGEAAVVVDHDGEGAPRLLAYVAPEQGRELAAAGVRAALGERLPSFMVPAAVVVLDRLPLTPNGKIDHASLPHPQAADAATSGSALVGETEELVATVWRDLLGVDKISRDSDLFDLGGHSLLAIRLLARLGDAVGIEIPVGVLFADATVAGLARWIDIARRSPSPAETPLVSLRRGRRPPRLVLAPPIGGSLLSYKPLAAALDADHPVLALESRQAIDEPLSTRAASYLGAIKQEATPFALAGWSAAGVLAHEIARHAYEEDGSTPTLVLIDSWPPPHGAPAGNRLRHFLVDLALSAGEPPPALPLDLDREAPRAVLSAALAALDGSPAFRGFTVDDLLERYAVFAANADALARHEPRLYPGPVHLVRPLDSDRSDELWLPLCGSLAVHELPGDHYSVLRAPRVRELAELVRGLLA